MARVSIWYDAEADLLDINFGDAQGEVVHDPSPGDGRIMQALDENGTAVGLLIHPLSSLARNGSLDIELNHETPASASREAVEAPR